MPVFPQPFIGPRKKLWQFAFLSEHAIIYSGEVFFSGVSGNSADGEDGATRLGIVGAMREASRTLRALMRQQKT
jgi:hypothetical protein